MKRFAAKIAFLFLTLPLIFPLVSCSAKTDYADYISEYRSEIYRGDKDGFFVTAYCTAREYPYRDDGVCARMEEVVQLIFSAPENTEEYEIYLSIGGQTFGGDASFDCVEETFSFSCSCPRFSEKEVSVEIRYKKNSLTVPLYSVRSGEEAEISEVVKTVAEEKKEIFSALKTGHGWAGEIRARLVFEEKCFYFLSLVAQNGDRYSCLADATDGRIFAEK